MVLKMLRTNAMAVALAAATAAALSFSVVAAEAAPKKQSDTVVSRDGRGVNYSYRAGPRTRVYISRRSWLDGGTEVLPGDRKFTDYALAPGYHFGRSIDRTNVGRNPLSDNYDLGGYPMPFPLY